MTGDPLVVRSGTGCDGWPPWATLCPKPVPGSESTLSHTFYHKAERAPGDPSHGFIAKVRVAGSNPVVRSKAQVRRHLRFAVSPGRASPWKGEGRESSRDDAPVKPL